jgi:hypothetical protein
VHQLNERLAHTSWKHLSCCESVESRSKAQSNDFDDNSPIRGAGLRMFEKAWWILWEIVVVVRQPAMES